MDKGTRKHFRDWCDTEGINSPMRGLMLMLFQDDPDYWGSQSYWRLHDAVADRNPDLTR